MTKDEVLEFLERLEKLQPTLKIKYLEYLVNTPGTDERFHTRLGLHHVNKIKDAIKKQNDQKLGSDSLVTENKKIFKDFLKKSRKFNIETILSAIEGLDLFDDEIFLYSLKNMHDKALTCLVGVGAQSMNFDAAEKYCLDQSAPLLDLLLEKVLALYTDKKNRYIIMKNEKNPVISELQTLKKYADGYESYCKLFLNRYASNEKMDASKVMKIIPDDWRLKENKEGKDDDMLLKYLALTLSDRVSKNISYNIARNAGEMEKLDLEDIKVKLQKPFVIINSKNICKVCYKQLGKKSFYVFPNGTVTHIQCAKSPSDRKSVV